MLFLQAHRNPFFDLAALVLHVAGYGLMYTVVIVWASFYVRPALSIRLLLAWGLTGGVVEGVKRLFRVPRPYVMYPDSLVPVFAQGGYSFPSGHVAGAVVIWGYLALRSRRRALWAMVFVYVVCMAWSRMYLGVHFPSDVAAGAALGVVLLWVFRRLDKIVLMRF